MDASDAPPVDWDALIDLAKDVSANDEMIETRMRSAATDIDAFIQTFIDEEPGLGEVRHPQRTIETDLAECAAVIGDEDLLGKLSATSSAMPWSTPQNGLQQSSRLGPEIGTPSASALA